MLFGMLNPVLDSMRGFCAASHLGRVQDEVYGRQVSLGSFSEAQAVFDSEWLKGVFLDLAAESQTSWGDARLAPLADKLKLVDGTLLPALPRKFVKKGEIIVADRYYGLEYGFFGELRQIGASHIIRIGNKPRMEIVEELVLSQADRAAGVSWQARVKLGDQWQGEPIRVVRVEVDGKQLLLATDLDIEAQLVALLGLKKTAK